MTEATTTCLAAARKDHGTRARAVSPGFDRALGLALFVCAALFTYNIRQADPDLFGYLAYGRLFIDRGLVSTDPFAYTSAGMDWVAFEYGSQILLWLSYRVAGAAGLIALKCLVGGACAWFVYVTIREATASRMYLALPIFVLCFSTTSRYFLFRPQLFTFAFFAVFVVILLRWLRTARAPLVLLPIVMLAWANLHGGFLAGLAVIGLTLALKASQNLHRTGFGRHLFSGTWALWMGLVACFLASFANPRGPYLWRYLVNEMWHDTNRRYIDEWRPTSLSRDPWSFVVLTLLVILLLGAGFLARRSRDIAGLRSWHWVASCIPPAVAAYMAVRHVPIAAIWFAPVLGLLASAITEDESRPRQTCAMWVCVSGVAWAVSLIVGGVILGNPAPRIQTGGLVLGPAHPCGAIGYLKEKRVEGNLFLPLWWGAYATWELYPRILVSMDGRNITLFDDALVAENLRFYSREHSSAIDSGVPARHDTDFLLIPAGLPIMSRVDRDPRWRKVFGDSDSTLFVRDDDLHRPILAALSDSGSAGSARPCPSFLE